MVFCTESIVNVAYENVHKYKCIIFYSSKQYNSIWMFQVFPVDYNFSYDLRGWPEMGHEETRVDKTTMGRYWVGLPDGRLQVVEYTAGPQGFMPRVSYKSQDM